MYYDKMRLASFGDNFLEDASVLPNETHDPVAEAIKALDIDRMHSPVCSSPLNQSS